MSNLSGPVTGATLQLYATGGSSAGPALYPTGTGWSERKITWGQDLSHVA